MEKEWPEMTMEFKRLQREQYELFCRKQHDYGPGNISVGTQLQTDDEVKLSYESNFSFLMINRYFFSPESVKDSTANGIELFVIKLSPAPD